MGVQTRLSKRIADVNNNNVSNVRNVRKACKTTQLLDGSTVGVGDLAWIRHIQCMDTPVIIQNISTDARIEVTRLFDDKATSLMKTHLAKSCRRWTEIKCEQKFGTHALFQQYTFRMALASLVNAIPAAKKRLEFCRRTLKWVLTEERRNNWEDTVWGYLDAIDSQSIDQYTFKQACLKFVYELRKLASVRLSNEELKSITMKILEDGSAVPLALPQPERVCRSCCKVGEDLIHCTGPCHAPYHKECIERKSSTRRTLPSQRISINWREVEDELENGSERQTRRPPVRRRTVPVTTCSECKRNAATEMASDDNNNNVTDHKSCNTCRIICRNDKTLACVECSATYHSKSACIPAGAVLLSQTQLACCQGTHSNDSKTSRKKSSICSVCCKKDKRTISKCESCASTFHPSCHRNQTKCRHCTTNQTQSNVVYTYDKRKWWPAIIISKNQLPKDVYEKRECGPGIVCLFIIGKSSYEQAHVLDLIPADNSKAIHALYANDNEDIRSAFEVATAIREMTT